VRGILDGHIVLDRKLAASGHYPAIDVLQSISRLISRIAGAEQQAAARKIRDALSAWTQAEDLIRLGAYVSGSDPRLDASIRVREKLLEFLQQDAAGKSPREETLDGLARLAGML
jgi:flagellum-specific ATP synthase/type III secretion protein N (ATPase)